MGDCSQVNHSRGRIEARYESCLPVGMTLATERCEATKRAGHLAAVFSSLKSLGLTDRELFHEIMRRVLLANSGLFGYGRSGNRTRSTAGINGMRGRPDMI
jgi:hypothetical protein